MESNNSALNKKKAFRKATMKAKKLREFYGHLRTYFMVNLFFFIVNWMDNSGEWWVLYPIIGWGFCLTIHAMDTFSPFKEYDDDWEERKARELVKKYENYDF